MKILYRVVGKLILVSLCLMFKISFSQQNPEFKEVKKHFDSQRTMLISEFKKKFDQERDSSTKKYIHKVLSEFMVKLDSVQNTAFVGALIRVKNREDLSAIRTKTFYDNLPSSYSNIPYPGGVNAIHQEINRNFYIGFVDMPEGPLKTEVSFVIDSDGSIADVQAKGEYGPLNRQLEIAMYLLAKKFNLSNDHRFGNRYHLPRNYRF